MIMPGDNALHWGAVRELICLTPVDDYIANESRSRPY